MAALESHQREPVTEAGAVGWVEGALVREKDDRHGRLAFGIHDPRLVRWPHDGVERML